VCGEPRATSGTLDVTPRARGARRSDLQRTNEGVVLPAVASAGVPRLLGGSDATWSIRPSGILYT
jgi:hypothetical protein